MGFKIELVVVELKFFKLMNFVFDVWGRLWVIDFIEYLIVVEEGEVGRDMVKIFLDEDGDGLFEKVIVFVVGLNILIGFYFYCNGCVVFSIFYIWWLEDIDGDGVVDYCELFYGLMGYE